MNHSVPTVISTPQKVHPLRPLVTDVTVGQGRPGYPKGKKRVRNNNTYSAEDKALCIVSVCLLGSQTAVSKAFNIPGKTINDWCNGRRINNEVRQLAKYNAEQIKEGIEEVLSLAIPALLDKDKLASETWGKIASGVDKLVQNHQLLNGLATSITTNLSATEAADRIASIRDRLKATAEANTDDTTAARFTNISPLPEVHIDGTT